MKSSLPEESVITDEMILLNGLRLMLVADLSYLFSTAARLANLPSLDALKGLAIVSPASLVAKYTNP